MLAGILSMLLNKGDHISWRSSSPLLTDITHEKHPPPRVHLHLMPLVLCSYDILSALQIGLGILSYAGIVIAAMLVQNITHHDGCIRSDVPLS